MPIPAARRPVILVSRDSAYAVRTSVTVAEVSRTIRGIPSEIRLSRRDGLPTACAGNTDNLVTIPKTWLERRITALSGEKLASLDDALRFSLGLR
jgi:mRNA interferase MazF